MRGFAPARRVTFVSAKVTKTISARSRPQGGPSAYAPNKMARELAPLKQLSPKSRFGAPSPPQTKAGIQKQERFIRSWRRSFSLRWVRLGLRPESYPSGEDCLSATSF